jgi:ribosomal protein L40E
MTSAPDPKGWFARAGRARRRRATERPPHTVVCRRCGRHNTEDAERCHGAGCHVLLRSPWKWKWLWVLLLVFFAYLFVAAQAGFLRQ